MAIIFLFYLFLIIPAYSWVRALFISADILHIGYLIFAIGRMLLSTLLSQLIVSISIGWHLHEQNGLLREQIGKIGHQVDHLIGQNSNRKSSSSSSSSYNRFHRTLFYWSWQHSCIVRFLFQYNRFHSYMALSFTVFNMVSVL